MLIYSAQFSLQAFLSSFILLLFYCVLDHLYLFAVNHFFIHITSLNIIKVLFLFTFLFVNFLNLQSIISFADLPFALLLLRSVLKCRK